MLLPSPTNFLRQLFRDLEPTSGAFDHLFLDHLCYRVESVSRYENLRDELLKDGNELLVESPINGRRISTFRLRAPFQFGERSIDLLELPEPKVGSPYSEGYEHVEFVTDRSLDAFATWLLKEIGVPTEQLDLSGINKEHNPDLRLRFTSGSSVKFHEQALDQVIAEELADRGEREQ
ncbi:MAG: VOC family protein [Bacteroidota bacterium]